MKDIVEEEGMMKYIQLNTSIVSATWNEDRSKWVVKLSRKTAVNEKDGTLDWEEECDLLLNGTGFLKFVERYDCPLYGC